MPFKSFYLAPDGSLKRDLSEAEIARAFESEQGLLWVDVPEINEDDGLALERIFKFHSLAVADCVSTQIHPPKIDRFDNCIFAIVHGINHQIESDIVETAEIAMFLGGHFLVTAHTPLLYSVAAIQKEIDDTGHTMKRGADFLAYSVVDTLVDNVLPTIDLMNDVADEIEEAVIHLRDQNILDGILKLKRSAMRVHRIMAPQREVMNRLSRGEFSQIHPEAQIFYRDIYDHVVRIEDLNQNTLDRADNALATYLSSVANRQNETMRVLSIVATIFMPLTLLAGIYGMNFEYMPELGWRWGYFVVLGVIILVILVLMWRFWASGWFNWGRKRMAWVRPFVVEADKLRGYLTPNLKRHHHSENPKEK
ncbi:MAG: magnesium/cobalt transporter CorA [Dehalococcoidales bacterium]|nr:magnesium/cobalt transporter CorA [Dehalococcoidales bacterium]